MEPSPPAADAVRPQALIAAALAAREVAYAPYSRFQVGAALECEGEIIEGCNVENASYGLCVCAERHAAIKAVGAGRRAWTALAVATDTSPPSPPCGLCLQTLAEFVDDLPIWLVNPQGEAVQTSLRALFPVRFDKGSLDDR